MPNPIEDAHLAIQAWLVDQTQPDPVVALDEPGTRPAAPYTGHRIATVVDRGHDALRKWNDTDQAWELRIWRTISVFIQTYRGNALGRAQAIRDSLDSYAVRESIRASGAGLSFLEAEDVQALPSGLDAEIEQRASIDLRFNLAYSRQDAVGYFNRISGQAHLTTDTGKTITEDFDHAAQ